MSCPHQAVLACRDCIRATPEGGQIGMSDPRDEEIRLLKASLQEMHEAAMAVILNAQNLTTAGTAQVIVRNWDIKRLADAVREAKIAQKTPLPSKPESGTP